MTVGDCFDLTGRETNRTTLSDVIRKSDGSKYTSSCLTTEQDGFFLVCLVRVVISNIL